MNTRGRGVHQSGDSHRRCELRQQHFYQGRLQALVYVAPACVCVCISFLLPRGRVTTLTVRGTWSAKGVIVHGKGQYISRE